MSEDKSTKIEIRLNKAEVLSKIAKVLDEHNYTYSIVLMQDNNMTKYQIYVKTEKDNFIIQVYIKIDGRKTIMISKDEYEYLFSEFNFPKLNEKNESKSIFIAKKIVEEKLRILSEREIICEIPEFSQYVQIRDIFDNTAIKMTLYDNGRIRFQGSEDRFFELIYEYLEGINEEIFDYFERNNLILEKLLGTIEDKNWESFGSEINYSQEQLDIINAKEQIVVVNACAGSGKTTTLEGIIRKNSSARILYLVYNKSIQEELKNKFIKYNNVKLFTSHGMAYKKYSTRNVTTELDLFEVSEKLNLPILEAKYILAIFNKYIIDYERDLHKFLNSYKDDLKFLYYLIWFKFYVKNFQDELEILKDEKGYIDREEFFKVVKEIAVSKEIVELQTIDEYFFYSNRELEIRLNQLMDLIDKCELKEPHDYYLKKFQILEEPKDKYDIVMLDEAQDANGVLIDIINTKFVGARKIIVGDTYQQIYSWRGAKNSLEYFVNFEGAKRYELTNSYRIGKDLGIFCTELTELRDKKGLNIKGKNITQKIITNPLEFMTNNIENTTILFRKNINMLLYALNTDKKVFFLKEINLEEIKDFLKFVGGRKEEITLFHYLKKYRDYQQLIEYVEKDLENNLKILMFMKLIGKYPQNLEEILNNLEKRMIKREELEEFKKGEVVILGTIHSAKGNEFKKLIIYPDVLDNITGNFLNEDELKEEVNLFYVALTRSKGILNCPFKLNSGLIKILANRAKIEINELKKYLKIETIKKLVEERKIEHIFHFTSMENIKNILNNGLICRKRLDIQNMYYVSSDENRLDNKYNYISTSISFPNYKMFYKKRIENEKNIYVLLSLKPNILWEKDCLFMPTNAASYKEIDESFSSITSLIDMFDLDNNKYLSYPKDVQAEVLVKDEIDTDYIQTIYLEKAEHEQELFRRVGEGIKDINYIIDRTYFNKRDV